jgi:hypothetical protein
MRRLRARQSQSVRLPVSAGQRKRVRGAARSRSGPKPADPHRNDRSTGNAGPALLSRKPPDCGDTLTFHTAPYAVDGDDCPTVFVGDKTGQRSVDGWAQSADPHPPLWVDSRHSRVNTKRRLVARRRSRRVTISLGTPDRTRNVHCSVSTGDSCHC